MILVFFSKNIQAYKLLKNTKDEFLSDNFRCLIGDTSFLLGLIRGGGGTVHVPRSAEVPHFSHMNFIRGLYIYFF